VIVYDMKTRLLSAVDGNNKNSHHNNKLESGLLGNVVSNSNNNNGKTNGSAALNELSQNGSNNSEASVLTQVYEASLRKDDGTLDKSLGSASAGQRSRGNGDRSFASKSFGLNYLFALDDPDALIPSNEHVFPRHVHNSSILTVFLLLNTMIGSGILNQPQVFLDAGVIPSTIMLAVTAFFTWLGLVALIDVGAQFEKFDFSELSHFAFGKWGEVLVDISIATGNFGSLLSYIIVIGTSATELLSSWGCGNGQVMCSETALTILIVAVCVTPVCLKRVFGELAIYSVISMVSIGSIVILTIVAGPIIGHAGHEAVILYKPGGMLNKLGSIIFALSCSFAAFHTYISLQDASAAKWRLICAWTMLFGFIMLFVIGIGKHMQILLLLCTLTQHPCYLSAGYLSFRSSTDGIILDNFTGHYADVFRIMLVIHMVLYIPVDFMTMRHSLVKLCGNATGQVPSDIGHLAITLFLLCCKLWLHYPLNCVI
jgi:amino acid permease